MQNMIEKLLHSFKNSTWYIIQSPNSTKYKIKRLIIKINSKISIDLIETNINKNLNHINIID